MGKESSDYRFLYAQEQIASQRVYDKSILTLSSGSFAVTFTFLDSFVTSEPKLTVILIIGWGLLALSIASQLCSHLFSAHAFESAIMDLDRQDTETEKNSSESFNFKIWTHVLNYISLALFLFGICSILIFVYFNFN